MEDVKEKIKSLTELLIYHGKKYYIEDSPEISDYEYDQLMQQLIALEEQFPEYKLLNSPTVRVGGKPLKNFEQVNHEVALESLQDAFSYNDLVVFDRRIKETFPDAEYVVEMKIDGLSVALEYENGLFIRGATRGDGSVGENVTENLKTIKDIPLSLNEQIKRLTVRGEVYMPKSAFEHLNVEREIADEPMFANPRNAAAGSLRQLDSKITVRRNLSIYVFNLQLVEGENFLTHLETLQKLKSLGFKTIPFVKTLTDIKEVWEEVQNIGEKRNMLSFDIDGAVIKVNNLSQRKLIGSTSKFPKWAIAFKYPPEQKVTKIIDIQINVGRTGVLTPLAILEPIPVAGSIISKATLHNKDFIREKDIRINDYAVIQKAGDIIPEVVEILVEKRDKDSTAFQMPVKCPVCGAAVINDEDDPFTRCINSDCPAQLIKNIIHFVSRDAMDIDGLGQALIERFVGEGLIKSAADLYFLKRETLSVMERLGEKSADNLVNAIEISKKRNLNNLIYALGIHQVGEKAAKILAQRFKSMDSLRNASEEELLNAEEIGPITSHYVIQYFNTPKNIEFLKKLEEASVNMIYLNNLSDNNFEGMTFVLTGSLSKYTREEASAKIESKGGKVSSSISKKTTYLLEGEDAGSKLEKARSLNINIISEEDFDNMI